MKDEEIIKKFEGRWESKGGGDIPDNGKAGYFPDKGVILEYKPDPGPNGKVYAKVVITGEHFPVKTAMQKARFKVVGEALVSTPIKMGMGSAGLKANEVLMLSKETDPKNNKEIWKMTHILIFSDQKTGSWVCYK